MKSLKTIGVFFISCLGAGIRYGTAIAFGYGAVKTIDHVINEEVAKDNYNKGIKVGILMEQNKKLNKHVESE